MSPRLQALTLLGALAIAGFAGVAVWGVQRGAERRPNLLVVDAYAAGVPELAYDRPPLETRYCPSRLPCGDAIEEILRATRGRRPGTWTAHEYRRRATDPDVAATAATLDAPLRAFSTLGCGGFEGAAPGASNEGYADHQILPFLFARASQLPAPDCVALTLRGLRIAQDRAARQSTLANRGAALEVPDFASLVYRCLERADPEERLSAAQAIAGLARHPPPLDRAVVFAARGWVRDRAGEAWRIVDEQPLAWALPGSGYHASLDRAHLRLALLIEPPDAADYPLVLRSLGDELDAEDLRVLRGEARTLADWRLLAIGAAAIAEGQGGRLALAPQALESDVGVDPLGGGRIAYALEADGRQARLSATGLGEVVATSVSLGL